MIISISNISENQLSAVIDTVVKYVYIETNLVYLGM